MLLHFKKSNEILETWSPHCKNLAFQDPPSLKFHNRTDISVAVPVDIKTTLEEGKNNSGVVIGIRVSQIFDNFRAFIFLLHITSNGVIE